MTKLDVKLQRPQRKNTATRSVKLGNSKAYDEYKAWYDLPKDSIAGAINQLIQRIEENNYDERQRFMRYARLYGNSEAMGWANLSNVNRSESTNNRPVRNVIQSCIDTVNSKIARDNPAPYFITSGSNDYFEKLKAEKLTQFVQGVFQDCKLYDKANNDVFRDGCVYGLGGLQFFLNKHSNKIDCEWVFIDELKVDWYDAFKKGPRSLHRSKMMAKEVLLALYPDHEEKINELCTTHPQYYKNQESVVEMVVVTESWHLKNGKNNGRHTVIFVDEVLEDEEYPETYFPFAWFRWYNKPAGFWGRSVTETILSGQVEINKILMFIQQCQELQASPVILTDNSSQIAEDVILSNNIARMIPYRSGTNPPQFLAPQACSPEIYSHLDGWVNWCYQQIGLTQTAANGSKQAGVNSAIAIRTMVDLESSRYIQVSKNWEQFFVDCAEIIVKLGKKAYQKDPDYKVTYMDKKSKVLRAIPWKKVNMPDDMFVIKCDTVSGFPSTAAGRIQTITDFISQQFISRERGMELLNLDPDLEGEVKLQTSSLRLCEKRLSCMVEDNEYYHPEKYMNLKLALAVSEATYNQLQLDECPNDRLELVRTWIREITTMLTGNDPEIMLLQQAFSPAAGPAPQVAPQQGLSPTQ